MKTSLHFVLLALISFSSLNHDVLAGESAADMDKHLCSVCHGANGTTSNELFPQLAGQPAPYLINQLKEFRDKSRTDENAKRFMWGISSRLTDDDIQQLGNFYESQTPVRFGKISDQAKYDAGKNIFVNGNVDKGVPACMACHGEKGEGKETIPRLGGQQEVYLKRQLEIFYGNERPAAAAMHEVVKGLSASDIDAVAHYLQAQ
jgi:cytochrome c553